MVDELETAHISDSEIEQSEEKLTKRDPRLEECGSCGNYSGTMYGFGKCAPCINSKGFDHVCACEISDCHACEVYEATS